MQYLTDEFWTATIELGKDFENELQYSYLLQGENGEMVSEWGNDRIVQVLKMPVNEIILVDTWNYAGEFENTFYTQPFQDVLLPKAKPGKSTPIKWVTHIFKVKAPLLKTDEVLCIAGSNETFEIGRAHV